MAFFVKKMDKGYILISRTLLDSDVFASQKLLKIWMWCLCKAGFKDRSVPLKVGRGETIIKVKRGEFIFGRYKAEEELFIDGSTIYKCMKKLEKMEMISIESNNQYSVITINKYDDYQVHDNYKVATKEQPSNNQVAADGQVSNTTKTLTNSKSLLERKEDFKNKVIPFQDKYSKELLKKFYNYWTEKNEKGKKMKFEKERTFEISKRLVTWKTNDEKFNPKKVDNLRVDNNALEELFEKQQRGEKL